MDERLQVYESKMKKTYEHLESDYAGIRAGRANPHVLDKIKVNYYGTPTPIQQYYDTGSKADPDRALGEIFDQGY